MKKSEIDLLNKMSEKEKYEYLLHKVIVGMKKEKERRNKNGL